MPYGAFRNVPSSRQKPPATDQTLHDPKLHRVVISRGKSKDLRSVSVSRRSKS